MPSKPKSKTVTKSNRQPRKPRGLTALGYRSGLEDAVSLQLKKLKIPFSYETEKIRYLKPPKPSTYKPDFILSNGIVIETKGRFESNDRLKHLLVKEQNPGYDIRFVFSDSKKKIYKGSPTTYADWCNKYGFKYADKEIPKSWLWKTKLKRT